MPMLFRALGVSARRLIRTLGRYNTTKTNNTDMKTNIKRKINIATIIALLVMAFIGFPPFAVFSAFASILLHGAAANFAALIVLVVCWFAAAWCLFRMMQRLLFGPHRSEIKYEDLRTGELAGFAFLLLLLLLAGTIQPDWLEPQRLEKLQTIAMEMVPWRK